MIFLELILQNFGPYYGRQVINLSPENNGNLQPIILLGGMNGGGKTTLMDAIRLAFYGQRAQCSTRGNLSYGDFLSQCVNRQAKATEEAAIELAFEHVLNNVPVVFRVKRSWTKKNKNSKDILHICVDKWQDEALTKTWDERVEDILPLGISNLFLFDGEQVKELAELETPPPQVIEAIQSLLGLELAEKLALDLDILVNRKRKELASDEQRADLAEIESKIQYLTKEKKLTKKQLAAYQNKLKIAQEVQKDAQSKFITEGGKIAAESSQLKSQLESLEQDKENQRQKLRELAADTLPLSLIKPLLIQAEKQGRKEIRHQQALVAKNILIERDAKLIEHLHQISLSAKKLEQVKVFLSQENEALQQEIDSETELWLNANDEVINQLNNLLKYQLPSQIKLAQEQQNKLNYLETEVDATERQLQIAAPPEAYQKLQFDLKDAQQQLMQAQAAYDAVKREYESLENALRNTKKELENYSAKNIDLTNEEHIVQSATKVQTTLKLFRQKLTLKKLNKLEIEVADCFRYLLHKTNLVHRVAIDSNNYSISLYDTSGNIVPKHRLSAGEKQLLAIALLWGLARVSGRNLPVAIDTPLGRLDSSHRNNLVERYFPCASHQVILLSTDTEISKQEVKMLRKQGAIAREYLLKYEATTSQTNVNSGYFW